MVGRILLVAVVCAAGCGRDTIEVNTKPSDDYKHSALVQAVDKYVAAGRTADAFAELANAVRQLRAQMDRTVAKEAELKLVTLALHPIQAMQAKSMREKISTLGLTVWPTLLAPAISADKQLEVRDPNAAELLPKPGEDPDQYFVRVCEKPLGRECKGVVPELQGDVIEALALRRGMERARIAITECLRCQEDPAWK